MALRQLTEADLKMILSWRNRPEVRSAMYTKHEITESEHLAWFSRMQEDMESRWYIYQDALGEARGVVYFTAYKPKNYSSFWGFYTNPDAPKGTGKNLGVDALDFAFYELKIHKLNAEVVATNAASLGYHRKLGFMKEGCFRDFHFDGSGFVDVIRFGLIGEEWFKCRDKLIGKPIVGSGDG